MTPTPILILYGTRGEPIPLTGSVIVLPGVLPPQETQEPQASSGQLELPL